MWIVSIVSVAVGVMIADGHRSAGHADRQAFERRLEKDAAEKSAFELAAWQDVIVSRQVDRTAALTAGDLATIPDAAILRLSSPPTLVPSLAERSPSALLLGTLDVAWVLALLLPLAAIALGYDSVSRDRERGTLAMLLVPARTSWPLLVARCFAVSAVLSVGVLPISIGAIFVGPTVVLLLLAYVWFVSAAVVTISAASERTATALAVSLACWLAFGVAVPLTTSATARVVYRAPDPRLQLAGEAAADAVFTRATDGIVEAEVEKDPEMNPETASDGATSQARYDFLLMREQLRRKRGARYASTKTLADRAELLEVGAWASPVSIVTNALASLGGTLPSERLRFADDSAAYRDSIEKFVRAEILDERSVLSNADRFPRAFRRPQHDIMPAITAIVLFLIGGAFLTVWGAGRLDRRSIAPTKEDA